MFRATLADPKPMLQFQLLIDPAKNRTSLTRRIEAVDLFREAATPCRLVAQLPAKLSPTRITDRLGQLMVFEQPGHVQILDLEVAELPGSSAAYLVREVFTLIGYPFGPDSHPLLGLFFPLWHLCRQQAQ